MENASNDDNASDNHQQPQPQHQLGYNEKNNASSLRRVHNVEHLDEEQGCDQKKYDYELLPSSSREAAPGGSNKKQQKSPSTLNQKGHLPTNGSAKRDSNSDRRSRALLFKTAFWIACWYLTSLATLFLNKIILSRKGSSVHVLGICQMTTAAVLGGWSAFGGADFLANTALRLWRSLPESVLLRFGTLGEWGAVSAPPPAAAGGGDQPGAASSRCSPRFARDMAAVGSLRGLTVVLGLVALEHVPVSFVETIKATAPAFTVIFARLILQERTATPVVLTLVPVVAGLVLCSAAELRFDTVGFAAAVANNCADCVQNVVSKRMLARVRPTQLQFYTSVAALALQTPFVLRDATGLIRRWSAGDEGRALGAADIDVLEMPATEDDNAGLQDETSMIKLLVLDAIW